MVRYFKPYCCENKMVKKCGMSVGGKAFSVADTQGAWRFGNECNVLRTRADKEWSIDGV